MTIHEPVTLLTDYLLAVLASWLAFRLHRRTTFDNRAAQWLSRSLALTAVSAFAGGSYHGFAPNVAPSIAATWWIATLLIISLLSAALSMSLLHELSGGRPGRVWRVVIVVKLLAFATFAVLHPRFIVAVADYGTAMLAWALAAIAVRRRWCGWMLGGIVLSLIAAVVQQARVRVVPYLNHNDLYHVIQAVALIAFYRAGRRLSPAGRKRL